MELLAVTYHYIDDPNKYKAGIYPVSPEQLEVGLERIGKHYTFIKEGDIVSAIRGEKKLPERSCVLTFDDGLLSQYENAAPILQKRNIPAIFFIPTMHLGGRAYTLHKVHYVLSRASPDILLHDTEREYVSLEGKPFNWDALDVKKIMEWYRYDTEAAAKFKFLINHHLPQNTVDAIVSSLFQSHSDISEKEFCERFYMSREHIQDIDRNPLFSIGLHTHDHLSIAQLSKQHVEESISKNFSALRELGISSPKGLSYPFGMITEAVFKEKVKDIADKLPLTYAFSIEKKINRDIKNPFLLGRFNWNDIPGGSNPVLSFS